MEIQNITFSVAKKLILLVAAIVLPFVLTVAYVAQQLRSVSEEIAQIQDTDLPAIKVLSELEMAEFRMHFVAERAHSIQLLGAQQPDLLNQLHTQFKENSQLVGSLLSLNASSGGQLNAAIEHTEASTEGADLATIYATILDSYEFILAKSSMLFDPASEDAAIESQWSALNTAFKDMETQTKTLLDAILVQSQKDAELLAQDESALIRHVILITFLIVVVSVIFAWKLIQTITNPLNQLTELSTRMAEGDLSAAEIRVNSSDELSVLAVSFRRMQQTMRDQIVDLKKSIETIGASIQQTSTSIQEQASSTKEEAATIQEITTTMQEIQQSGSEIGERAKEISERSDENMEASQNGLKAVEATSQSMHLIREQIEEVAEKIVNLSDKTQAIGDIVTTVNDIAEQSNILAINASIEAASAGESGSRFSVVAQEMKNLADQAKESTRQVRVILGDIQKGINTSVMLTEEAVKRSEVGKTHAEIADSSIRELLEATQESMDAFQQIMAGTNQQQIGVDQVAQGMRDIRQAVQQTVAGISELEQATKNLNEMSQQLRGFINRYTL